ncbi:MAG: 3'-5' exonuclease [Gammaproteobacteria bacterium]|nr:3'-5' exonuclease [Gammaproteobacteria bacterium]
MKRNADSVVVLDFETTGLSPGNGDRAIEIGAVKIKNGIVIERFQSLMNPGKRISGFIESYTGITNKMLTKAPPCKEVMRDFAEFISGFDLVAHNASFDKRFLDAELKRIRCNYSGDFACSMLVARRLYQTAPNHKLETLVRLNRIKINGDFHRALSDAEMTANLWLSMLAKITDKFNYQTIPFAIMQKLAKTPKLSVEVFLHDAST